MKKLTLYSLLSLMGFSCANKNSSKEKSMLLWEDNYLMVELVSNQNLTFAQKEIERIAKFGEEHHDGAGYTEITQIEEKPIPTDQLKIPKIDVVQLLKSVGLSQYPKIMYYGGGEPTESQSPNSTVYGDLSSGIFLEHENGILKHIWFDSHNWKNINKTKIGDGLKALGEKYDLILVDWNSSQIVDLKKESEVDNYLKE